MGELGVDKGFSLAGASFRGFVYYLSKIIELLVARPYSPFLGGLRENLYKIRVHKKVFSKYYI